MLHIIGIILKCIGILLAVILGIIVLVSLAVLFVPIRYEVDARFPGKAENISVNVKVTWFLHMIRADVAWKEQKLDWRVRAVWKVFGGKDEEEKSESTGDKEEKKVPEKTRKQVKENVSETVKDSIIESPQKKAEMPKNETPEPKKEEKAKKIKKKIQTILDRIKCTFQRIYDKIKAGANLKDKIVKFLTNEVHKSAFMRVKKELIWLKRFFKVTKGNINLRFGLEDPALTGQVLGVLSALYPLLEGNMYVEPDFEDQCLEGNVYLKGRLRLIHPTVLAVKLLIDKNIRQTYKDIKALKSS